ncbi:MAG: thioredoxin-disulfide reductase [Desulfobacterales bacterium]|nr:thioredoxin-disulfide reductase [Desulfobacterales bacterium]
MMTTDYELVIIGGGVAGLTAGMYAARSQLKVILIEKLMPGGQILSSDWVENYPGFPEGINGADLSQRTAEQAIRFGLPIQSDEVLGITLKDHIKIIQLSNRIITTQALIIATGASPRKLNVPGEDNFFGKGVATCATCDGPFYKNRIVAAIGGGDTAVQESAYLTRFVQKLYLIHRRDELRATAILQERIKTNPKIEIIWNSVVTEVHGKDKLESITLQNTKTKTFQEVKVDGCFVWVGIIPNTQWLKQLVALDSTGFVVVNANMETSVPGIYAAGDVRNTPLRQLATAVGDGAIAAVSAQHYIESFK